MIGGFALYSSGLSGNDRSLGLCAIDFCGGNFGFGNGGSGLRAIGLSKSSFGFGVGGSFRRLSLRCFFGMFGRSGCGLSGGSL